MGIALWLAGGVLAFVTARLIPHGRNGWVPEAIVAVLAAVALGLVATYLDFGGWEETDWRAPVFAAFGSLALLGLVRLFRLARRLRHV